MPQVIPGGLLHTGLRSCGRVANFQNYTGVLTCYRNVYFPVSDKAGGCHKQTLSPVLLVGCYGRNEAPNKGGSLWQSFSITPSCRRKTKSPQLNSSPRSLA